MVFGSGNMAHTLAMGSRLDLETEWNCCVSLQARSVEQQPVAPSCTIRTPVSDSFGQKWERDFTFAFLVVLFDGDKRFSTRRFMMGKERLRSGTLHKKHDIQSASSARGKNRESRRIVVIL